MDPLPQTRQGMLSLATRLWENIKYDEKDPRKDPRKPTEGGKSATLKEDGVGPTPTPGKLKQAPRQLENKEDRPKPRFRRRGPKKFASGKNNKGEQICFVYSSAEHFASHHKKDDKGDTEQPKTPGVHVVKTTGRKKGQERTAQKVWDELLDSSEND